MQLEPYLRSADVEHLVGQVPRGAREEVHYVIREPDDVLVRARHGRRHHLVTPLELVARHLHVAAELVARRTREAPVAVERYHLDVIGDVPALTVGGDDVDVLVFASHQRIARRTVRAHRGGVIAALDERATTIASTISRARTVLGRPRDGSGSSQLRCG